MSIFTLEQYNEENKKLKEALSEIENAKDRIKLISDFLAKIDFANSPPAGPAMGNDTEALRKKVRAYILRIASMTGHYMSDHYKLYTDEDLDYDCKERVKVRYKLDGTHYPDYLGFYNKVRAAIRIWDEQRLATEEEARVFGGMEVSYMDMHTDTICYDKYKHSSIIDLDGKQVEMRIVWMVMLWNGASKTKDVIEDIKNRIIYGLEGDLFKCVSELSYKEVYSFIMFSGIVDRKLEKYVSDTLDAKMKSVAD